MASSCPPRTLIAFPLTRMRGPGDLSLVDGVADCGVGRPRTFRTHVALGSKAGQKIGLRGQGSGDHPLGHGLDHGLKIFRAGVEKEMNVGVDQARHQGRVAEIDGLRTGGMGYGGAGSHDLSAFDQDLTGGENTARFYIEKTRGVENDGLRCGRSLRRGDAG